MDEDKRQLVRSLCAQAGMIMEDASATAVLSGRLDDASLRLLVGQVASELDKATRLVSAATALLGSAPSAAGPTR